MRRSLVDSSPKARADMLVANNFILENQHIGGSGSTGALLDYIEVKQFRLSDPLDMVTQSFRCLGSELCPFVPDLRLRLLVTTLDESVLFPQFWSRVTVN